MTSYDSLTSLNPCFIQSTVHSLSRSSSAEHLPSAQNHLQQVQRHHILRQPAIRVESQIHLHHVHTFQLCAVASALHDSVILYRWLSILRAQRVEYVLRGLRGREVEGSVRATRQLIVIHVDAHQTNVRSHVVLRPEASKRLCVATHEISALYPHRRRLDADAVTIRRIGAKHGSVEKL